MCRKFAIKMKLVKVSAMWCPDCLIMRSRMDILNLDIEQVEYDYDLDDDIVKNYNVGDILPVFILFDGDKELRRLIGEKSEDELKEFLKGCIK